MRGDLGKSLLYHYDVMQEIGKRLPITLYLGLISFAIGCIVGPFLGVVSAVRRGKWLDSLVTVLANVGITAPSFWIGVILIYVFGLYLRLLPIYGYTSPFEDLWKNLQQSIMPILVLATFPIASAARQTRSSVIEVMQQDYIRTAWAKGLSERVVIMRHVLKNALMPVVTLQGMLLRNIIGGSVVVETVFAIPGMGKLVGGRHALPGLHGRPGGHPGASPSRWWCRASSSIFSMAGLIRGYSMNRRVKAECRKKPYHGSTNCGVSFASCRAGELSSSASSLSWPCRGRFAPFISPYDPYAQLLDDVLQQPDTQTPPG